VAYRAADITLYIPYYQAQATIAACLDAVASQTQRPGHILVVDDGSATAFAPPAAVELLQHPRNLGLAAARNTALQACKTPLLAALDADVAPATDWLEALLECLNCHALAGVGGKLIEHVQDSVADRWRAVHMCQNWGDTDQVDPRFLFGANTLFRTEAVRAAGGYDQRLRTNNEDRTLCDKLYEQGHRLRYCAAATCRHLRRDTMTSILPGYWKWHHAKGLLRGDFDRLEGVLQRIAAVNFGIFRYRFDLDRQHNRHELLGLDAALPWVFCLLDLQLFATQTGTPESEQLRQRILAMAPMAAQPLLPRLLPTLPANGEALPDWAHHYLSAFAQALEQFAWHKDCATEALWQSLRQEL